MERRAFSKGAALLGLAAGTSRESAVAARSNGHKVWRDKIVFREHCHALGVRVTIADISDRLMP